jgi:hypothetical protein
MLSTAGPSCPTCGASIEPGTHLYSEIANSSWHRLCWKHTTSTEMHLTIVWFNHELFKHVDAKHRCTAIICQMLLKKRKDLYYICCTEEEKGPLLHLLYWRRERTFTIFVVLVRERTFTIFVVLVTFLIMSYVVRSEISWLNDWMIDSRLLCTMKVTESVKPDFRLLP